MNKQQKFLWIIQTALLVNVNRLTAGDLNPPPPAEDFSMSGNWTAIVEAIRASERIPSNMTAEDAANEYCTFMFSNQRKAEERSSERTLICPAWFAR